MRCFGTQAVSREARLEKGILLNIRPASRHLITVMVWHLHEGLAEAWAFRRKAALLPGRPVVFLTLRASQPPKGSLSLHPTTPTIKNPSASMSIGSGRVLSTIALPWYWSCTHTKSLRGPWLYKLTQESQVDALSSHPPFTGLALMLPGKRTAYVHSLMAHTPHPVCTPNIYHFFALQLTYFLCLQVRAGSFAQPSVHHLSVLKVPAECSRRLLISSFPSPTVPTRMFARVIL